MTAAPQGGALARLLTLPAAGSPSPPWRAKASVFEDPRSRALLERIHQLAPSDATVLVVGETGTGKEIIARHIHARSRRGLQPFLAVNCGALSPSLIESELFGHDRGAFTGAVAEKAGWFESAHGGTLFLDEIGDLPLDMQVKLLRVLQEREVVRLGSNRPLPVNVRLIAATNVRLEDAVGAGKFRPDLFYRIAVARVTIDPLRDRPGDILPLAHHFLDVYASDRPPDISGARPVLTAAAEHALLAHPWMGNIRELENAIQYAVLVCRDGRITPSDLPLTTLPVPAGATTAVGALGTGGPAEVGRGSAPDPRATLRVTLASLFEEGGPGLWAELEEAIIRGAYVHARHNQLRTARLLGLTRSIVRARLLAFGVLSPPDQ